MRTIRNIGHVKRRKRAAKWSAILGFLLLTATFWLALYPELLLVAYGLLFAGFVIFNAGMQQVGKWARNPRNDAVLDSTLQRLSDKYALIHYPQLGKQTVEHLLVHPGGVLVLTARELPGQVVVRGGRWRRRGLGLRRFFGLSGPQLGNPSYETRQGVAAVERHLAESQLEVDVDGVVVFLNPQARLDVEDPEFPVLTIDELPAFVQQLPADTSLRPAERQRLVDLLAQGEEIEAPKRSRVRRPVRRRRAA